MRRHWRKGYALIPLKNGTGSGEVSINKNIINEPDRAGYGNFQTIRNLSDRVGNLLKNQNAISEIIIEPTCGKENFIISSLKTFENIKYIDMELKFTNIMYGKPSLVYWTVF